MKDNKKLFPFLPMDIALATSFSKIFNAPATLLLRMNHSLKSDLTRAEIDIDAKTYITLSLFNSLVVFVMVFFSIFVVGAIFSPITNILKISYFVSLLFLIGIFGYNMTLPKMEIIKTGKRLEKDLLFAMRYLSIRVRSGVTLYDAMVGVAHGEYGEVSIEFKKLVKSIASGTDEIKALENLAIATPSPFFRRVIWQIANNMRTGSDISDILAGITDSLVKEHKILIRKYGSELNPLILLYMMFSIVIPALGITVLVVMSSFTGLTIPTGVFYLIPVVIFVMQLIFMSLIKGRSLFSRCKMEGYLEKLGRLAAGRNMDLLSRSLDESGLKVNPAGFLGFNILSGFLLSITSFFLVSLIIGSWTYGLIGVAVTIFAYYFIVSMVVGMLIDQRASDVAKILPDALQLMSSNLRSGMATEEALMASSREEFGVLGKNIKYVGNRIAMGKPIAEAIVHLSDGIQSDLLKQTVELVLEGIESGGELSSVLEGTADDIRESDILRREVRSILLMYAIFIFIAAVIISPVIYAVSTQLAGVLSELSRTASIGFLTGKNIEELSRFKPSMMSKDFLVNFAYINIVITSVFGSLMVALINKGNEKYGVKYIPFMLAIALVIFYVSGLIMQALFGGIRIT